VVELQVQASLSAVIAVKTLAEHKLAFVIISLYFIWKIIQNLCWRKWFR